jgi:hypothetical protein
MQQLHLDPFLWHRAALYPWRRQHNLAALDAVLRGDLDAFCDFLIGNGLGPLWNQFVEDHRQDDLVRRLPSLLIDRVRRSHLQSAAISLAQGRTLRHAADALSDAGVGYAFYKGAALREIMHANPGLRPMEDIDVLVARTQKEAALKALIRCGMVPVVRERLLSHELQLVDKGVHLDLHWRLFRPGRSRFELADELLGRRVDRGGVWHLDETANLLVMLVHPAIVKRVSGPRANLVRLVELDYLLRRNPDWTYILEVLSRAGLRTAAWSVLYRLGYMMGTEVGDLALQRLQPRRMRRGYIAHWIEQDLPVRLADSPLIVKAAFSLAMHDRMADAVRAVIRLGGTSLRRKGDARWVRRCAEAVERESIIRIPGSG